MGTTPRPLRWLEVTADYRCNNRCVGCFSVAPSDADGDGGGDAGMSSEEAISHLVYGRRAGAEGAWFGGGEPTLRRDLSLLIATARRLGYRRVKLQTNGMLLAYPDYTRRLVAAGLSEVNFSLKGATAEEHDRLTRTPGCHDRLVEGIAQARAAGLSLEGDVLLYRDNAASLPELVRRYATLGLTRFHLWLYSAMAGSAADADDMSANDPPCIAEVMPHITAAMDAARALGLSPREDFITSLHTPPCTVPRSHHAALFYAPDLALLVTNPGGHRFLLEDSPIEGGVYFERCGRCAFRSRCGGARADYVARFGDAEFQPVIEADK